MKNLKKVSEQSKLMQELVNGRNIWLPLFYSDETDAVYTSPGSGRELVTHLINANTPKEIKDTVTRWKWR